MTTETLTLTDFLLARIAEDEEVARRGRSCGEAHPGMDIYCSDGHPDPRALAECKAKRVMVENSPPMMLFTGPSESWVCRALASIYADHEDFRADWSL
jgi:hypothetical protein